jgi:putative membrane protein
MEVIMLRNLTVFAVVLGAAACSQRLQPGSPEFEQEHNAHNFAIAANVGEIEEGRLAIERSANTEVRNLAQMIVNDHSTSLSAHLDMAGRFGEEWAITANPGSAAGNAQPAPPVAIDLSNMNRDELLESPWSADLAHSHEASMKALREYSGAEFDRAYVDRQIAVHRNVLARIDALLPAIITERMRTQLQSDRTAVAAHLATAEQLRGRL